MWNIANWIADIPAFAPRPNTASLPSATPNSQRSTMNLTATRASYTGPEDSKLSWDWTALDRASPIERAPSTTISASGRKRHMEGSATDDTGSNSHKRFKHEHTTHAQFSKPLPSTKSTMRAPASSPTRPKFQSSLDYNLSQARTIKPKQQAQAHVKVQGPFMIDSDDSDDETPAIIPARRPYQLVERPVTNIASIGPSDDLKITQRFESQRLREEAIQAKRRHGGIFTSPSTLGRSENAKPQAPSHGANQTATINNAEAVNYGSQLVTFAKSLTSGDRCSTTNPPTLSSFNPFIKSESRPPPAPIQQQAQASGVVDLTGDDTDDEFDEVANPPRKSQTHEPKPGHDRRLPLPTDSAQVELRNIRAKEQAEKARQDDQRRKAEEAASKAKAAELRQQQQQEKQRQADELAHLHEERRAREQYQAGLIRRQQAEQRRSQEQHRLNAERLAQERALKRPEQPSLPVGHDGHSYAPRQQPERQIPVQQQQYDDGAERRLQVQRRERKLAEQREEQQRELALEETHKRQLRVRELEDQQEKHRQEQLAKEYDRRQQERAVKEQERQRRERELANEREKQRQRDLAKQRDMQIRKAAFEKAKAENEQKRDEKRLQDQLSLEHEKRKGFVAKPIAEVQREQQLEMKRQARIQKHQERNAQNRMREEEENRAQQQAQAPLPQSLSNLSRSQGQPTPGRERLPVNYRSGTVLASETHEQPAQTEDEFRKIRLAEITYEDTQLLKWRNESDHNWAIIRQNFIKLLHSPKAENTLRLRYTDVTALMKQAGIGPDTMRKLYQGSDDVLKEVNRIVDDHRATPLYAETKMRRKQHQDVLRQQDARSKQSASAAPKKGLVSLIGRPKPRPSNDHPFTGVRPAIAQPPAAPQHALANIPAPILASPTHRPTTGGKTLDEAFFFKMLDDQTEVWREMMEEDEESAEEEELEEADYVYWIYVVRRRQWLPEDLERCENDNEEEPEWIECDGEYEEVGLANTAASDEVMKIPRGRPAVLHSGEGFDFHCKVGEDDMKSFTVETGRGKTETAVARRLRTYQDRIRPKSRLTWPSKTLYQIMERITKNVVDEVLDETKDEVDEKPVGDSVYYALEQANEVAAQHFVKLTFTSDSSHYTVRTAEKAEQVRAIIGPLDGAEQLVLEGVGGQEGSVKNAEVKVWVRELQAVGPRN